jgi:hypothetical protein
MTQSAQGTGTLDRRFPQFESIFDDGQLEKMLQKIAATCRKLEQQARSADPGCRQRANAALAGYNRTLELIRELAQVREQMAARSNK